jgi:hypothetical protein
MGDRAAIDPVAPDRARLRRPHTMPRIMSALALVVLVLAVCVQVFVWGRASASSDGGALLPGLRSTFGTAYAAILLGVELAICLAARRRESAVWVLVAAAAVDVVFWSAHGAGVRFALPGAAAMTAAFGAVAMAGSLWWRRPRSR